MSDTQDNPEPPWKAAAEAHKRAMPLQRLTGNGMDYADVVALYAAVDDGVEWQDAAERLGRVNLDRANEAAAAGHDITARSWWLAASACFRVAQVVLEDGDRKRDLFTDMMNAYGAAGALNEPPVEHWHIAHHDDRQDGQLGGWLTLPASGTVARTVPVVVIFGGFDGWREEYHVGATYLHQRGVATLLLDGPGQGESRLFGGLVLTPDFTSAFAAVLDRLQSDPRLTGPIGIWGNSMGGFLAAAVAAADPRIAACCVNGGTVRPAEILQRYPRFTAKVRPLLGIDEDAAAVSAMETYTLGADTLNDLRCPLLVLHGTPDQVFLVANARALYDQAASTDKTWREWPDGDHCIYNHSHEKHTLVADWFADRLHTTSHAPTAEGHADDLAGQPNPDHSTDEHAPAGGTR
ncbi:alpha/beta fold hydrolase [Nocardioides plantarum]|uniref:Alpha/beta fold hydrolase n=1 Tax=Nocardioides plantarum TaxID=29299 RepID=A0ABV5KDM9_9ACTN|nr:alpha/beta fold hydrolase [Nocardioides plantarum]